VCTIIKYCIEISYFLDTIQVRNINNIVVNGNKNQKTKNSGFIIKLNNNNLIIRYDLKKI
jgi:hypothetical protein